MMTGTPADSSIYGIHLAVCLLFSAWFAFNDIKTGTVPAGRLALFQAVALVYPVYLSAVFVGNGPENVLSHLAEIWLGTVSGFAVGFLITLTAALCSTDGTGMGGGDIRFCAVAGSIFHPSGICRILVIAALSAVPAVILAERKKGERGAGLPFLPFLFLGEVVYTILKFC